MVPAGMVISLIGHFNAAAVPHRIDLIVTHPNPLDLQLKLDAKLTELPDVEIDRIRVIIDRWQTYQNS